MGIFLAVVGGVVIAGVAVRIICVLCGWIGNKGETHKCWRETNR